MLGALLKRVFLAIEMTHHGGAFVHHCHLFHLLFCHLLTLLVCCCPQPIKENYDLSIGHWDTRLRMQYCCMRAAASFLFSWGTREENEGGGINRDMRSESTVVNRKYVLRNAQYCLKILRWQEQQICVAKHTDRDMRSKMHSQKVAFQNIKSEKKYFETTK